MRLEIQYQNRLGLAQDILNIMVEYQIDIHSIEVESQLKQMYVSFPPVSFDQFQEMMTKMRRVTGVTDIKTTAFMPSERKHNELMTLLSTLPEGIIGIDLKGQVTIINESALHIFALTNKKEIEGKSIQLIIKGINFSRWLESDDIQPQTRHIDIQGKRFVVDVLPVMIPDDNGHSVLASAVINLKSEGRLDQHLIAFKKGEQENFDNLHAKSSVMRRVVTELKKMAQLDAPILITGETGTGKELLARACHADSNRHGKLFLAINCGSMPDDVAESELFGYGANAFPGKPDAKKGIFEQAHGGTVFLDEVGDMSHHLQTKFLRFLQDGSFRRVGEENEVQVDVRIVCTTQKDLTKLVQNGKFREDLFYRLNVLTVTLPPLRERKQDILPLAEFFIERFSKRLDRPVPKLTDSCCVFLQQYSWPGNVRQLENALNRAVTLLDGNELKESDIHIPGYVNTALLPEQEFDGTLDDAVKCFEANLLRQLFPAYPSSRQLAQKLGLSHTAVANKLRDYGINRKTVKIS